MAGRLRVGKRFSREVKCVSAFLAGELPARKAWSVPCRLLQDSFSQARRVSNSGSRKRDVEGVPAHDHSPAGDHSTAGFPLAPGAIDACR